MLSPRGAGHKARPVDGIDGHAACQATQPAPHPLVRPGRQVAHGAVRDHVHVRQRTQGGSLDGRPQTVRKPGHAVARQVLSVGLQRQIVPLEVQRARSRGHEGLVEALQAQLLHNNLPRRVLEQP